MTRVMIVVRLASLCLRVVTGVTGVLRVLWMVARVVDRVVYRMVWLMRGRLGSKWYDVLLLVWGWKTGVRPRVSDQRIVFFLVFYRDSGENKVVCM